MDRVGILVVEDDVIVRTDLAYRLTDMGYQIAGLANNGPQALAIYQKYPVDLLLIDINLAGEWDGIETARRMQQIRSTPLIFLTAMTDKATIERARLMSPSAYITKPFDAINLQITVDLAIHNFNQQATPASPAPTATTNEPVAEATAPPETAKSEPIVFTKEHVFVRQNYRFVKFRIDEILYLESDGNYTHIITVATKYTLRMVLNKVLEKLHMSSVLQTDVLRVHRSYAVNLRQISSFSETEVIVGAQPIPIGRSYRDQFAKGLSLI